MLLNYPRREVAGFWHKTFREWTAAPFEERAVFATLVDKANRATLGLSGTHHDEASTLFWSADADVNLKRRSPLFRSLCDRRANAAVT